MSHAIFDHIPKLGFIIM